MSPFPGNTRVYLATGATDMRKAIDGLSILVAERLALDPFSGHLFAFCNRGRTNIKILYSTFGDPTTIRTPLNTLKSSNIFVD